MNHQYLKVLSISIVLACCNLASAIDPKDAVIPRDVLSQKPSVEQKKLGVVRRMYQATDGMLLYCANLPKEQYLAHKASVEKFWASSFPKYRKLMESSPYYEVAKREFEKKESSETAIARRKNNTPDSTSYQKECAYYQAALECGEDKECHKGMEKYLSILDENPAK